MLSQRMQLLDSRNRILFEYRARIREAGLMPSSQDPLFAGLGQAVRIGTNLLATLMVGGGLGWSIDSYLLPTEPWGLVGGLILGLIAGIRNAYRTAQRWDQS